MSKARVDKQDSHECDRRAQSQPFLSHQQLLISPLYLTKAEGTQNQRKSLFCREEEL